MDVGRIHEPPKVVFVVGAVEPEAETRPDGGHNRCDARRRQVARVARFQLDTEVEVVARWRSVLKPDEIKMVEV